jgi:conjugative relaxase-like TrwC/TraI family protein
VQRQKEASVHRVLQDQVDEFTQLHQGAGRGALVVLSIGKLSLGQEAYYLQEVLDGAEDYYLHAGEAPGCWLGSGAAAIGLGGEVSAEDLRSVLAGNDPATGESLRATRATLPGLDLTLSAPKSVSLVWGLGNQDTARTVVECHEGAVGAAITFLERHACQVRRGHAGADTDAGRGFIAAAFRHRTSRLGDPTLHTHVLVANLAEGADGRWTALDGRPLYQHARPAGFVYQAVLRYELARSLGLLFEEVEQGHADVAGVPVALRGEFSGRRRQILDQLERHGASSAKAAQAATLDTRDAKSEYAPEAELRKRWARRAAPFGFSVDRLPTLVRSPVLELGDHEIAARVAEANATFECRDVARVIAQAATQGAPLDTIEDRAAAFLASSEAVTVGVDRWTTPEILAIERRTVDLATAGVGADRCSVAREVVNCAITSRPSLGSDQARAVRTITESGDSVSVLIGPAGTGKTFCLDAARDAWEATGHRVVGVALAARAAAQLELGAGIQSQTADRLLLALASGKRRLDDRTILVVDESGMLGTRRLAALIAEADPGGAKVVLVGDPKQLPEIDAGGLFASLAHRLGYAELTRNRRQRDVQERAAAHELRNGDVERAMARLERNGNVTTADNADLLRNAMVSDWCAARDAGRDVVMVAGHRPAVADLNERAREVLQAAGRLGDDVLRTNDLSFAIGDEVLAHQNRYDLGILNGDRGIVRGATTSRLQVELEDGRNVETPAEYIDDGHLTHGYATTVHKAQGTTCDRALVLGDDTFTVELGYTSLTRGRDRNQLYLVAPVREEGHGRATEIDPVASFTRSLHRSGAKTSAIDALEPMAIEQ